MGLSPVGCLRAVVLVYCKRGLKGLEEPWSPTLKDQVACEKVGKCSEEYKFRKNNLSQ